MNETPGFLGIRVSGLEHLKPSSHSWHLQVSAQPLTLAPEPARSMDSRSSFNRYGGTEKAPNLQVFRQADHLFPEAHA